MIKHVIPQQTLFTHFYSHAVSTGYTNTQIVNFRNTAATS